MSKAKPKETEALKLAIVFLSRRIEEIALAVDDLGKVVGLEWTLENRKWRPIDTKNKSGD